VVESIGYTPYALGAGAFASGGALAIRIGETSKYVQPLPQTQARAERGVSQTVESFNPTTERGLMNIGVMAVTGAVIGLGIRGVGSLSKSKVTNVKFTSDISEQAQAQTLTGSSFGATATGRMQVTSKQTIGGFEIPGTTRTQTFAVTEEIGGIGYNVPKVSFTAKLGSAEGQSPMLVQSNIVSESTISQFGNFQLAPTKPYIGILPKESLGFQGVKGAVTPTRLNLPPNFEPVGGIPSLETTSLRVSYPSLVGGKIFSEVSPAIKTTAFVSPQGVKPSLVQNTIRAVSEGGKGVSEISATTTNLFSSGNTQAYSVQGMVGRTQISGIAKFTGLNKASQQSGAEAGGVFPQYISESLVTGFDIGRTGSFVSQKSVLVQQSVQGSIASKVSLATQVSQATQPKGSTPIMGGGVITIQQEQQSYRQPTQSLIIEKQTAQTVFKPITQTSMERFPSTQEQKPIAKMITLQNTIQPQQQRPIEIGITQIIPRTTTQQRQIEIGITQQQVTTNQHNNPFPILPTPITIPPRIPIGGVPFFPSGFGDSAGFTSQKGGKAKGRYQPSFTAVVFNIRGKAGKSEATGFGLRPIAIGKKPKRK
jgi:hypothetical protein